MQISYMKPIYQGGNQKGGTYSGGTPTTTGSGKGACRRLPAAPHLLCEQCGDALLIGKLDDGFCCHWRDNFKGKIIPISGRLICKTGYGTTTCKDYPPQVLDSSKGTGVN